MAFADIITSSYHHKLILTDRHQPVGHLRLLQEIPLCSRCKAVIIWPDNGVQLETSDSRPEPAPTDMHYRICLHDTREEGWHFLHCSCHDTTARFISLVRDDAAVQKEIASDVTDCALLASAGATIPLC
jgi:hypothetical protein